LPGSISSSSVRRWWSLTGVGYRAADVPALVEGSLPQRRLLDNAPVEIDREVLTTLYEGALSYW